MATKKATKKKSTIKKAKDAGFVVTQDNIDNVVQEIKQKLEQAPKKEYLLWLKFNDQEYTIETDDIRDSLLAIKPANLKTRILFKIQKGSQVCDKILSGMQARQIFRNKLAMTVFLNRLIFK